MTDNCPSCGQMTHEGRMKFAERAREHPIYKTDLSKPLAELVAIFRDQITTTRGQIRDVSSAFPGWKDELDAVEGLLTCGLVYLHNTKSRMEQHTLQHEGGEKFHPRGIGSDHTPGCFCCGGDPGLYANISGFATSKESGEKIVAMFEYGARLDYRGYEPNWIQVKIGACKDHLPNLEKLCALTAYENVMTPKKIEMARNLT